MLYIFTLYFPHNITCKENISYVVILIKFIASYSNHQHDTLIKLLNQMKSITCIRM